MHGSASHSLHERACLTLSLSGRVGRGVMDFARVRMGYIAAVLLYGTVGLVVRFVNLPSEVIVLFRGAFGGLSVLAYMLLRGRRPDVAAIRTNLRWLLAGGVCLGLNWVFLFAAYVHTTVAMASLCNYMAPIILIAISPVAFGERVGPKKIACVVFAFVGIALVSNLPALASGGVNLVGLALGMLAAFSFVGVVFCNRHLRDIESLDRVVVQLLVSAVVVLPYALAVNGGLPLAGLDVRSWLLLALLCVVQTGVAYIFYFGAMGTLPVLEISLLGYIEPVTSVLCSALVLGESLGAISWAGAALVIAAADAGEVIKE